MRTPALFLLTGITAFLTGCTWTAAPTPVRQPLLSGGRGVDHVTILTNEVAAAADEYAKRLGFTVGSLKAHSFGFTGATIDFVDGTYLELYGIHDPARVAEVGEGFALEASEGVKWVTLHSGSVAETTRLLNQRAIPMWGPFALPEGSETDRWLSGPERPAFPGGRLFFIEYNEELRAKRRVEDAENVRIRETHANAAVGLRSVWVAVRDLSSAAATYEAAGFSTEPETRLAALDKRAREIKTPAGSILLVEMTAETESERPHDSFAGISIKTADLDRVRTLIEKSNGIELKPYQGLYGRSILVPSALGRGASIEFFE